MSSSFKYFQITFIFLALLVFACTPQNSSKVELTASIQRAELPSLQQAELPSLDGKNVLIVYGGWPGHKPELYAEKATKLLSDQGAIVTVSESLDIFTDATTMSNVDLIVICHTMSKIEKAQINALLEKAVKNGAGLAGAHGGFCDTFRNNREYQYMVGAQFVAHPGDENVVPSYFVEFRVNIKGDHPITRNSIICMWIPTLKYWLLLPSLVRLMSGSTGRLCR